MTDDHEYRALRAIKAMLIRTPHTEREALIFSLVSAALNLSDGLAAQERMADLTKREKCV